jgi:glycosyltransferase involved in cell wall biosynthesis
MNRIAIIGSHGIPARYGGFETFAEHLAVSLADEGFEVTVVSEKNHRGVFGDVRVKIIYSKYKKSKSPVAYYHDSILKVRKSDVVIVCGSGGSSFYGLISKSKIITNIDGLESKRKRYSFLQRMVVSYLQKLAIKRSHVVVTDSKQIQVYWENIFPNYKEKIKMIPYGADICLPHQDGVLGKYSLNKSEYFLVIARLVPENNIEAILNAFRHYKSNKKLVIVGDATGSFGDHIKKLADKRVHFTGAIYEKVILDTLRQNCYLYLHGHSVGGTNPSLLEAMAAGCACLCHDNAFNRETTSGLQEYFTESFDLAIKLNSLERNSDHVIHLKAHALKCVQNYTWNKVTESYVALIRGEEVNIMQTA